MGCIDLLYARAKGVAYIYRYNTSLLHFNGNHARIFNYLKMYYDKRY